MDKCKFQKMPATRFIQNYMNLVAVYHHDGMSPSTFYQETYGVPLDVSKDSNNISLKKSTFTVNLKTILLVIAVIIFFVIIIILFLHFKNLNIVKN